MLVVFYAKEIKQFKLTNDERNKRVKFAKCVLNSLYLNKSYHEVVVFETKNISITMVFRIHKAIKFVLSARKRLTEEGVFMKKRNFR